MRNLSKRNQGNGKKETYKKQNKKGIMVDNKKRLERKNIDIASLKKREEKKKKETTKKEKMKRWLIIKKRVERKKEKKEKKEKEKKWTKKKESQK